MGSSAIQTGPDCLAGPHCGLCHSRSLTSVFNAPAAGTAELASKATMCHRIKLFTEVVVRLADGSEPPTEPAVASECQRGGEKGAKPECFPVSITWEARAMSRTRICALGTSWVLSGAQLTAGCYSVGGRIGFNAVVGLQPQSGGLPMAKPGPAKDQSRKVALLQ
jgi:hypothetical protein